MRWPWTARHDCATCEHYRYVPRSPRGADNEIIGIGSEYSTAASGAHQCAHPRHSMRTHNWVTGERAERWGYCATHNHDGRCPRWQARREVRP